jgi:hypothetical protein
MKKNMPYLLVLAVGLLVSGCSQQADESQPSITIPQPSTKAVQSVSPAKPSPTSKAKTDDKQTVTLDHLLVRVNRDWQVNQGLDSAAFQINGKSAAGIDGLGYDDAVENLLPNRSEILEQKKLKSFPVKAEEVILKRDTGNGKESVEVHMFIFLKEQKVVYDLHADQELMKESDLLEIVKTAAVK